MKKEMDYLRYHSFLNAITREFEGSIDHNDPRLQKRLLAYTIRIIDAFAEIYGDTEIKKASNHISRKLASNEMLSN